MIAQLLRPSLDTRPAGDPQGIGLVRTLADLRPGQKARITGYVEMSPTVQRLLHLGLLKGVVVSLTRRALTGDPIEIRILDYSLSLRRREAALLEVETLG
jgi:ferrous iron transport protein A